MTQAQAWNERYAQNDRLWIPDADSSLKEAAADIEPTDALDLGCGEGRNALYLARAGFQVTAVDFANVALERLKAVATTEGLTVQTVCEDMFTYLTSPHQFHFVVLANIHPPRDRRQALYKAIRHVITPGGRLYLIGHHVDSLGIAGPPDKDLLIDEDEIKDAFREFVVRTLKKVSDISDHGHPAPSLVAVLDRPLES